MRWLEAVVRTNPEVPAIYEATFEHGGVLVRVDILQRHRDGRWRLIEVKSTTDLRDHHLEDAAIQARVVSGCGVDLASVCLAHINRNYVFEGGSIDIRRFFKIRNLTRRLERLQPKECPSRARDRDDLRRHGGRGWRRRRAGLGNRWSGEDWISPSGTGSGRRC